MSKTEDIWLEVLNILTQAQSSTLSYVKEICSGVSESLPIFPSIVLEPLNEREENYSVPQYKRIFFQISIIAWMEVIKKEAQIIGSAQDNNKGILDIARDIRNVLSEYPDLNKKCQKISFPSTTFSFENYPYRSVEIVLEAEYLASSTNR